MDFMNFGASVTGTKHIKNGLPNQDAYQFANFEDGVQVMALSDGHGGSKHIYSDVGAMHAVNVAVEAVKAYFETKGVVHTLTDLKMDFEERLSIEIQTRWLNKIMQEPLFESSIQYGCTLLLAVKTSEFIIFLQIGDGKIAMIYEDGVIYYPVHRDTRYDGNVTASMVQEEAWLEMKVKVLPLECSLHMVVLASDGVENAYPNGYYDDAEFYANLAKDNNLADDLIEHLENAAYFSKDDTTAVLWINPQNQLLADEEDSPQIWVDDCPEDWIPLTYLITSELHKRLEMSIKFVDYLDDQNDELFVGTTLKGFYYDQSEKKLQLIPDGSKEKLSFFRIKKLLALILRFQVECSNRNELKRTLIKLQQNLRYDQEKNAFVIDSDKLLLPTVSLEGANGQFELFYNSEIYLHQIMPLSSSYNPLIGKIVQHPKLKGVWGMVNYTNHTWEVYGNKYERIAPGKTMTLRSQMTAFINSVPIHICIQFQ